MYMIAIAVYDSDPIKQKNPVFLLRKGQNTNSANMTVLTKMTSSCK